MWCGRWGSTATRHTSSTFSRLSGELVLYVDGMHGLIQCNDIIQWLYELTRSKVHIHSGKRVKERGVLFRSPVPNGGEGDAGSTDSVC